MILVHDDTITHAHGGDLDDFGPFDVLAGGLDVEDGEVAEGRSDGAAGRELERLEQGQRQAEHGRVVDEN